MGLASFQKNMSVTSLELTTAQLAALSKDPTSYLYRKEEEGHSVSR